MDQHTDNPKTRYISTATSVFAEKGYNAASLADVANQLGVTKQALLHFFGSKAALYEEVLKALSNRLLSSIQNVEGASPEEQLRSFFLQLSTASLEKPADTQLVLRALLDAQVSSESWPLKPFLDALGALAHKTKRWSQASDAELFCWIYQLIGSIQHFAISQVTLKGMYGAEAFDVLRETHSAQLRAALADLEKDPG
ncbi:transcriptional regulator, TetR family [Pseudovibrio sp. FO-BEG1]|uniref:TetR/AcrR family transcriptional regulator n=1 Tax=Pseudovibrio sp. (strain FO-BEG1) TaxID=911045 RepID=UPI000238BF39|nr:TetR/AcrR family transcriptional regulator [Pseudovibrio sp. FO-BEG1]AEV36512.1 transcriptional regulator, TetR family [Pseudovibrio sp. FO-BEG1]